jgi:hypothetical protein
VFSNKNNVLLLHLLLYISIVFSFSSLTMKELQLDISKKGTSG